MAVKSATSRSKEGGRKPRNIENQLFRRGLADYAPANRLEELSDVRWRISAQGNPRRVTYVPPTSEPFPRSRRDRKLVFANLRQVGEWAMFSLREVDDDKFIYRCHQCGWESEIMTTEQAVTYSRLHQCPPKSASPAIKDSPKAS
jgi:hypothetical protein